MKKLILMATALLGIVMISPASLAGYPYTVDGSQATCDPQYPSHCIKPDASGNVTVNGSFSLGGFTPSAIGTPLSASNASSNVALPAGSSIFVLNVGTTNAYVNLGVDNTVTATTAGILVPAGGGVGLTVGTNTYLAGITASGTTTINIAGGSGLAQNMGSGPQSVRMNDGSGNAITSTASALDVNIKSGAAAGGTSSNFAAAFPGSGTAIGIKNGANMVNATADGSNNLNVNCAVGCSNPVLATGGNVIGALAANQSTNVAQVAGTTTDTNSGVKSAGTLRVVLATDQPQLTNKLLVTPDANSAVNVAQINGVAPTMGNGVAGTGVQRVTIASDSTGSLSVTQATAANLKVDLSGTGANATALKVDGSASTQPVSGTITANLGTIGSAATATNQTTVQGPVAAGAATATKAQVIGGQYNSTPITLTDGQQSSVQFDANGYLKVNTAAGAAAGGTSSNFGSAFPTPGTAIGAKNGANMVNLTADGSNNLNVNCATGCSSTSDTVGSGNLTSTASITTATLNSVSNATIQITGSWVATLQFEGTVDGTNYFALSASPVQGGAPVSSATANGNWTVNVAGLQNFRVRASAYTSGTVVVTARNSTGNGPNVNPDGVQDGATLTATVSSATNIITYNDTTGFGYLMIGFTAVGGGATLSVDTAPDGTTFVNGTGMLFNASGTNGLTATITTPTTSQAFIVPITGKGMRLRLSAYTSGTYTLYSTLKRGTAPIPGQLLAQIQGTVGAGSADSGNPVKVGCKYNSTLPTLTDGQRGDCQIGTRGSMNVSILGGDGATRADTNASLGDGRTNAASVLYTSGYNNVFNGTTWDRVQGAQNATNSVGTGITASAGLGQFDDVSPTSITENSFGNVRMSANRNQYQTIRDAAGNERGANVNASNQLSVSVDNSNVSTNVAQLAGTTTDTNSGVKSAGTLRVVLATDQPALTNKLLVTPDANSAVNMAQVGGTNISNTTAGIQDVNIKNMSNAAINMGNGASGTGVQRVTIASDSTGQIALATGANTIGALTANQSVNNAQVAGATTATAASGVQKVGIVGNAGSTVDAAIGAGTAPTNMVVHGGIYNSTEISPTTGQSAAIQLDSKGRTRGVVMDAAGNTRGANVNASNQLSVSVDNSNVSSNVAQIGGTATSNTTAGILDVNVKNVNNVATTMNNGVAGTGVQRVTIASDSTGVIGATESGTWTVQPGNTANTTAWLTQPVSGTAGGTTVLPAGAGGSTLTAANTTNSTNVKSSAGTVYHISGYNNSATLAWLSLYNNASAPTCGTNIVWQTMLPANSTSGAGAVEDFATGLAFTNGIGFCVTTGIAGTGAVAASSYVVNIGYK